MTDKTEFEIESELRELGFYMGLPLINNYDPLKYTFIRDRLTNRVKYFYFYNLSKRSHWYEYIFRYNLFEEIEPIGLYANIGPVGGFEKCIVDNIASALVLYKDLLII